MPNGSHYDRDDREVWEMVRDIQNEKKKLDAENDRLRKRVIALEREAVALKIKLGEKALRQ